MDGVKIYTESEDIVEGEIDGSFTVYAAPFWSPWSPAPAHILTKFTKPEHSLNVADRLSLITPEYCRSVEGDEVGLKDKQEATIVDNIPHEISIQNLSAGWKEAVPFECVESSIKSNLGWMLCMAQLPLNVEKDQKIMQHFRELGLYRYTMLKGSNITRLAFHIGIDFGRYELKHIKNMHDKLYKDNVNTRNAIVVLHGPVIYLPDKDRFLKECKNESKWMMNHFVKRREFSIQREYRFLVMGWGPPKCQQILLPISNELRSFFGMTANNCG